MPDPTGKVYREKMLQNMYFTIRKRYTDKGNNVEDKARVTIKPFLGESDWLWSG